MQTKAPWTFATAAMRKIVMCVAGLLAGAVTISHSAFAASDPVFGDWMTVSGGAKVRIAPCLANPALTCGTLVWLKKGKDKTGGPVRDLNNPDAALKGRSLIGVLLVSNLKREATGVWTGGKIYVPETGRTARANLASNPDGTLKVEGCVAVICQTRVWTKAN